MGKLSLAAKIARKGMATSAGFIKEYGPEGLIISGIIGGGVAIYLGFKAGTKAEELTEKNRQALDNVNYIHENGVPKSKIDEAREAGLPIPTYTEEDYKNDIRIVKTKAAISYVKLFAPAVGVGTLSAIAILTGNHILRKRCAALAAACAATQLSFEEYRGRIREEFGNAKEREIFTGIKAEKMTLIEDDGNGNITESELTVNNQVQRPVSEFAFFWGPDYSNLCEPHFRAYNVGLARKIEQRLVWRAKHEIPSQKLTLNDIQRAYGVDETDAGYVVGIDFSKDPYRNTIFGIDWDNTDDPFVSEYEDNVLLIPQVDPVPLYGSFARDIEKKRKELAKNGLLV